MKGPKIIATYVAWREPAIRDSIRTVTPWVNGFAFYSASFPGMDLPRDDTDARAIAACTKTMRWENGEPCTEVEGRNRALELARQVGGEDAWALVVDADELLLAEWPDLSKTELGKAFAAIRAGEQTAPLGLTIYSTNLLKSGAAPNVSEARYRSLPIVAAAGSQPRIFPLQGAEYREAIGAPGLYVDGLIQHPEPIPKAILVNMRHAQSYEDYQADYRWEHPE